MIKMKNTKPTRKDLKSKVFVAMQCASIEYRTGEITLEEFEAVLETAQALCRLIGKSGDRHLGNSYRYIERYAQKIKLSPLSACTRVLGEVEQVLNLILNTKGGA
jgi:hypothetical protein